MIRSYSKKENTNPSRSENMTDSWKTNNKNKRDNSAVRVSLFLV